MISPCSFVSVRVGLDEWFVSGGMVNKLRHIVWLSVKGCRSVCPGIGGSQDMLSSCKSIYNISPGI